MQSTPCGENFGGWNGSARPVNAGARAGRTQPRSSPPPSQDTPTEEAFPEVLNQVASPNPQRKIPAASSTQQSDPQAPVSSDFSNSIPVPPKSNSQLETGEGMTAWLAGLFDGLAVNVSALSTPLSAGVSEGGKGTRMLMAAGTQPGRSPLDALLKRLQGGEQNPDTIVSKGADGVAERLGVLPKGSTQESTLLSGLMARIEAGEGLVPEEEALISPVVTIRHADGLRGRIGENAETSGEISEGLFSLDSDPDAQVLVRRSNAFLDEENSGSSGNGFELQGGEVVRELRQALSAPDRFAIEGGAPTRSEDLTHAVRQAQAAIADMVERMQGEVSLNTESLRAVLRLDPPALGRLNIRLEIDETQRVVAYLHADDPQTGDFLRQNEKDMRQGFERQGFDSEKVRFVYEEEDTGSFHPWLTEKAISA